MTSRAAKSVTVSQPTEMLEELDRLCKREHRNRSELLREAFRCYVAEKPIPRIPIVEPEPEELDALDDGVHKRPAGTAHGEYVLLEDLLDDH
jgi:predicted transcriptional regulator